MSYTRRNILWGGVVVGMICGCLMSVFAQARESEKKVEPSLVHSGTTADQCMDDEDAVDVEADDRFSLPKPNINIPSIRLPSFPKFKLPKTNLPKLPFSKIPETTNGATVATEVTSESETSCRMFGKRMVLRRPAGL